MNNQIPKIYEYHFKNIIRELPVIQVEEDLWLVENEPLCFGSDVEFTVLAAATLANLIVPFKPEILLTVEAKPLALAFEICKQLKLPQSIVARKAAKFCEEEIYLEEIDSITGGKQSIILRNSQAQDLKGKKVVLFDDTISTGGTMAGLAKLARKAGAQIVCVAAVWKEGDSYQLIFKKEIEEGTFIYLDTLPLFTSEKNVG